MIFLHILTLLRNLYNIYFLGTQWILSFCNTSCVYLWYKLWWVFVFFLKKKWLFLDTVLYQWNILIYSSLLFTYIHLFSMEYTLPIKYIDILVTALTYIFTCSQWTTLCLSTFFFFENTCFRKMLFLISTMKIYVSTCSNLLHIYIYSTLSSLDYTLFFFFF